MYNLIFILFISFSLNTYAKINLVSSDILNQQKFKQHKFKTCEEFSQYKPILLYHGVVLYASFNLVQHYHYFYPEINGPVYDYEKKSSSFIYQKHSTYNKCENDTIFLKQDSQLIHISLKDVTFFELIEKPTLTEISKYLLQLKDDSKLLPDCNMMLDAIQDIEEDSTNSFVYINFKNQFYKFSLSSPYSFYEYVLGEDRRLVDYDSDDESDRFKTNNPLFQHHVWVLQNDQEYLKCENNKIYIHNKENNFNYVIPIKGALLYKDLKYPTIAVAHNGKKDLIYRLDKDPSHPTKANCEVFSQLINDSILFKNDFIYFKYNFGLYRINIPDDISLIENIYKYNPSTGNFEINIKGKVVCKNSDGENYLIIEDHPKEPIKFNLSELSFISPLYLQNSDIPKEYELLTVTDHASKLVLDEFN